MAKKIGIDLGTVNVLVGFETLKAGFGWSDEEAYDHFCFDVQVRYALVLDHTDY